MTKKERNIINQVIADMRTALNKGNKAKAEMLHDVLHSYMLDERRRNHRPMSRYYVVNSGGKDGLFWSKVLFPNQHWSQDKIDKYIEMKWNSARPSIYDCGGELITKRMHVHNGEAGVFVYTFTAYNM